MISMFNLYLQINGYDIKSAGIELDRIKSLSVDKFFTWQKKKMWSIADHHYRNNRYYRNLVGGDLPNKWENLPIINKSDYQSSLDEMLSDGYTNKNTYIANTSGSSGHPFFFAKNKYAHSMTWAYIQDRYNDLEILPSSKEARFYGIPLDKRSYYKEKVKDRIMNRVRFQVFDLSDKVLKTYIEIFRKTKFVYIYGYTNSIVLFSRYIIRNNIDMNSICPSLRKIIVTSEVCIPEDRKIIHKAFKLPVFSEYGASEFGYIGYEVEPDMWEVGKEMIYIENDSSGCILITDLFNLAFPFIRYNIGDIATIENSDDGNQYIHRLEGRLNDNICLPSGKISPGLTFYYISRSLLESTGVLKEFIIRQTSLNKFIFDIVSDRPINNKEKEMIKRNMDRYLEPGLLVEINNVNQIDRPESGKIKHFYSEIDS